MSVKFCLVGKFSRVLSRAACLSSPGTTRRTAILYVAVRFRESSFTVSEYTLRSGYQISGVTDSQWHASGY